MGGGRGSKVEGKRILLSFFVLEKCTCGSLPRVGNYCPLLAKCSASIIAHYVKDRIRQD